MDRRGRRLGVLAGVLLLLVAVGIRGAAPVAGPRVLVAEKEGGGPTSGQKAGSQSPASAVEGGPSNSSPELQNNDQNPVGPVPRNSPPQGSPSNSLPSSHAASNPPPLSDNAPPHTPGSGILRNPSPTSGSPSHPPPGPGKVSNPSPSSLNGPPSSSGSPSSPSSSGVSRPPASGNHPTPPESRIPDPVPTEHAGERPPNGNDGKDKVNTKETGSNSGPVDSQGKGKENDKKKNETSGSSGSDDSRGKIQEMDRCKASTPIKCNVTKLVACVLHPPKVSQEWHLLIQNEGESPLNVTFSARASMKIDKSLQIPKGEVSEVKFNVSATKDVRIVRNAGNDYCIWQPLSSSPGNAFQQFQSYASYVTPIYGAYVVSLSIVFAGGTWVCCKFRKRGRRVGVPYQQLEMGTQHQSSALVDENVTDGWDDGWNDDWDEEEAVPRPPEKQGSASENGVAFRSTEKNEWEDWDD